MNRILPHKKSPVDARVEQVIDKYGLKFDQARHQLTIWKNNILHIYKKHFSTSPTELSADIQNMISIFLHKFIVNSLEST